MYAQLSVVVDCENVRKPDGKKLVVLFFGFNTARLESHTYSVCSPAHHGANAYMYVQYYRYAYIRVTEYTTGTERNAKDCLWPCCPSEKRLRSRCETDALGKRLYTTTVSQSLTQTGGSGRHPFHEDAFRSQKLLHNKERGIQTCLISSTTCIARCNTPQVPCHVRLTCEPPMVPI